MKKKLMLFCGAAWLCLCSVCSSSLPVSEEPLSVCQTDFINLINIKNVPTGALVRGEELNVFSDMGAWTGYALPVNEVGRHAGAFIGPMTMDGNGWIAITLAQPFIRVNGKSFNMARTVQYSQYLPGRLMQVSANEQLAFRTELCFISSRTALVKAEVVNQSTQPITLTWTWRGGAFPNITSWRFEDKTATICRLKDSLQVAIRFATASQLKPVGKDSLLVTEKQGRVLQPGERCTAHYLQTVALPKEDLAAEMARWEAVNTDKCLEENATRWNQWLATLLNGKGKYLSDNLYRRILVKAMMTLNSNWRSAAGDLLHDGSLPSYIRFNKGFWAWDSWKIASGNALFHPEMAKDEMRAFFDHQAANGMVADYIGRNKATNNWRDTKPPLATWGAMNVYRASGDKNFVAELFPKLLKFHRWWYTDRDHDRNGICEYGSTDGTLIAAAWESGMDNAVRFDETKMLPNGDGAWSMNQESVCLNSFLYVDKQLLAEMADLLGQGETAKQLRKEAEAVAHYVRTRMYDAERGVFCDRRLETGEFIEGMGPECWLPLWAGIATKEQAKAVMEKMMDPNKFNSTLPLGTLAVDQPQFCPVRGYWRGPVWVDQVYFGITGLRRYGFTQEADRIIEKFIRNAQGLIGDGPIHENYNPLTGERQHAANFGWSSALIIKTLLDK